MIFFLIILSSQINNHFNSEFIWAAQIYREEGLRAFWKGNGTNVIRVAPYAAAQLSSNDFYKRILAGAQSQPPRRV